MITADLITGNCISLIAAVCTVLSSLSRTRRRIYELQAVQCMLLAVASVFFHSYAGIVTLLACALRNHMAAMDRLGRRFALGCLFFVLIAGILLNNRGAVGWIIIAANAIYTVGMYLAKRETVIKLNMILNLALWILYECFILDIPSIVSDVVALGAAAISLARGRER